MSYRAYAYEDYGLLLEEDDLKKIASTVFCCNEEQMDDVDISYKLYDIGIISMVSEFTGEACAIGDDGKDDWGSGEEYDDDSVCYIPITKCPSLFARAYKDINEMVLDFKQRVGNGLPQDFPYRERIRHIVGTYYG